MLCYTVGDGCGRSHLALLKEGEAERADNIRPYGGLCVVGRYFLQKFKILLVFFG